MACRNAGVAHSAEDVFSQLLAQQEREKAVFASSSTTPLLSPIEPTMECFAMVANAWLQVSEFHRVDEGVLRAREWLWAAIGYSEMNCQDADESGIREGPNVNTTPEMFTSILKRVAESCPPTKEMLDVSFSVLDAFQSNGHVLDWKTLDWVLNVAMQAGTAEDVRYVLDMVKKEGLLSKQIVQTVCNGRLYRDGWTMEEARVVQLQLIQEWPFPPAWTIRLPNSPSLHPTEQDTRRTNFRLSTRRDVGVQQR